MTANDQQKTKNNFETELANAARLNVAIVGARKELLQAQQLANPLSVRLSSAKRASGQASSAVRKLIELGSHGDETLIAEMRGIKKAAKKLIEELG